MKIGIAPDGYHVILPERRAACPACGERAHVSRMGCMSGGEPPYPEARLVLSRGDVNAGLLTLERIQRALLDCTRRVTWTHGHGVCLKCDETWLEQLNPEP